MKNIGLYLLFVGVGSMVLHFFNMEFKYLLWMDSWGEIAAWFIRGSFVVVGTSLLLLNGYVKNSKDVSP
ncbi:hypothetical protein D3C85_724330 [compost metagenome]